GYRNYIATGSRFSSIGGGWVNAISGLYSAIPGGDSLLLGSNSFGMNVPSANNAHAITDLSAQPNTAYFGNMDLWLGNHVNTARVMRYDPNGISPNITGGYSGNSIAGGGSGNIIAGGGASAFTNQITTGSYATISGGYSNRVSGTYSTIGGGYFDTVTGNY